ncbi:hypothetical protein F4808DRAFT_418819 [Astrocystis sublimbata]|nr:hypothetical protein F4808DRAFT_418819 [Astrocystis sublimbata]
MEPFTKSAIHHPPQWKAALLGFAMMFSVGTVYALSSLQVEIPSLVMVSLPWSYALFAAASLGISIGVKICPLCMDSLGTYNVAICGTCLWGMAVTSMSFFIVPLPSLTGILGSLLLGGIGVGLTYLATIVLIGQAFPNQPLARSAIGPSGFASGTGSWLAVWSHLQIRAGDANRLGGALRTGGLVFICIAATAFILAPSQGFRAPSPALSKDPKKTSARRFIRILLFFNALPGMAAFGSLLPIASFYGNKTTGEAPKLLPHLTVALAFGGFFASAISSRLGAKLTFVIMFCARGLLLLSTFYYPTMSLATVTLMVVFFAHGAGFSLIPGMVKAQQTSAWGFPYEYGEVLTAWGLAGVLSSMINAICISSSGDAAIVTFLYGLSTLAFGIFLYDKPEIGGAA